MQLTPGRRLYFMGIAGTGMASVAGLCKEAGFEVCGSDVNVYPPMSTMLDELGIKWMSPYAAENLPAGSDDLVVVANSLSRGHPEVERALAQGLALTSFPEVLGEGFLRQRLSLVVTGTHGKTTSSSLLAHLLHSLGEDPSFVIGGIPRNFPRSFRLGQSPLFIVEGDEYDTAFFDKEAKFLHYYPSYVLFNNLEYDHADIFPNLAAIEAMFHKLLAKVKDPGQIIANTDDPGVTQVLAQAGLSDKVCQVAARGLGKDKAKLAVLDCGFDGATGYWWAQLRTQSWGTIALRTRLAGPHNIANIAQVIACLDTLTSRGQLQGGWGLTDLQEALLSFKSVKKRLDHLGQFAGVDIYEDFAHHPTAVREVIAGFRMAYPGKRLLVAFEPRNASSRRNVFTTRYIEALSAADQVLVGACPLDTRIPVDERMCTATLAAGIGAHAHAFDNNEALLAWARQHVQGGDAVIFMSSGSFSAVPHKLAEALQG